MSHVSEFIEKEVREFSQSISNDINSHSGKAAGSLKIDNSKSNHIKLVGADYIEILNRGSRPWKNPENYKSLGYILKDWAKSKGINPFAAAYNIAHLGSQIFQKKKPGLQIEKKRDDLQNRLNRGLPIRAKADVIIVLNKFSKQFKNSLK